MIWWYWILLGLALAAIELATPGGFFVIFFAVGALLVGLIEVAGILEADPVQWALFTVVSVASLAIFRKPLLHRMNRANSSDPVDSLVELDGEIWRFAMLGPRGHAGWLMF